MTRLLLAVIVAVVFLVACGSSGPTTAPSGTTGGSSEKCQYLRTAATYLLQTNHILVSAENHIANPNALQGDMDEVTRLIDQMDSRSASGLETVKEMSKINMISTVAYLRGMKSGVAEAEANDYSGTFKSASNEIGRLNQIYGCQK